MSRSTFMHVKILGMKTLVLENYIDTDDEIEYFDNDLKKLVRQKKMIGL